MGPDLPLGSEHLVEKIAGLVFIKQGHESGSNEFATLRAK
jgi:hypothetical protein